ncbi:MAG TPA: type I-U CRISPR-associated RAMP protein Csb1/Cas7u [Phycisphaerales bacterium]|nr:type I-U CRISPR-associated RAMP protein Csb1/Cas7u [Phycisphaerales bacterium]HMP36006.1 type I-U CRISPR-associated RAMP protein Csb1/Cas7u [Phycisphaerales bacterium]
MPQLTLSTLQSALAGAAALRSRTTLQPAGGPGTKVFPPTYAGSVYATEKRRLPGRAEPVPCVLLDSVQSQANRIEDALQQAIDAGALRIPVIEVDFGPFWPGEGKPEALRLFDPVGRISSLQAPHRIADAILRDSLLDGAPFRASEIGRRIGAANIANATPLYEHCPTALLLGMWDSTGPKGGLGAKFERALVSEIVGIDAVLGVKSSSRIDPLAIQVKSAVLYAAANSSGLHYTDDPAEAAKEKGKPKLLGKDGKPSEANHGNVTPSLSELGKDGEYLAGGVTISSAEQSIVISLAALRRLRFPIDGAFDPAVDAAGRTVLAALGLCGAALAAEQGLDLRSRCLLWPEEPAQWELLARPGTTPDRFTVESAQAIDLLGAAVAAAAKLGLRWREEPVVLTPSEQLVRLVARSQKLAATSGGEEVS